MAIWQGHGSDLGSFSLLVHHGHDSCILFANNFTLDLGSAGDLEISRTPLSDPSGWGSRHNLCQPCKGRMRRAHSIYSLTHLFAKILKSRFTAKKTNKNPKIKHGTMPQSVNFGFSLPGFKFQLCPLLAVGLQASDMASLICLICKMGVMMVMTSWGFCEDEINGHL